VRGEPRKICEKRVSLSKILGNRTCLRPVSVRLQSSRSNFRAVSLPSKPGAPVFDLMSGKLIAVKVGDRTDLHSSYVIPLHLATSLYKTQIGLDLINSTDFKPPVTKEDVSRVLSDHLFAVKKHDLKRWEMTLSSFQKDLRTREQDAPKEVWPTVTKELNDD
jgi:hypothetical protein